MFCGAICVKFLNRQDVLKMLDETRSPNSVFL